MAGVRTDSNSLIRWGWSRPAPAPDDDVQAHGRRGRSRHCRSALGRSGTKARALRGPVGLPSVPDRGDLQQLRRAAAAFHGDLQHHARGEEPDPERATPRHLASSTAHQVQGGEPTALAPRAVPIRRGPDRGPTRSATDPPRWRARPELIRHRLAPPAACAAVSASSRRRYSATFGALATAARCMATACRRVSTASRSRPSRVLGVGEVGEDLAELAPVFEVARVVLDELLEDRPRPSHDCERLVGLARLGPGGADRVAAHAPGR